MERRAVGEFVARVRGLDRRAQVDAAATEAFDALDAAGVRSLLLKGPALARLLYAADEHRGYTDVDLLVAPPDLPRARRALSDLGYANRSEGRGIDDVAGILHAEIWLRFGEDAPLAMVDLHWRLAGCEAPAQIAWDALRARRTWIELEGRRVAVLDRVGLALHLATHAAQHGPDDAKATADLRRGIERWPLGVWRAASRLAGDVGAIPAFAAGLRLVPTGAELASELELPWADTLTWEILHRNARPRGTFHLQAWAQARGARERAEVLRRSLFPTPEWIAGEYPWAAGSQARLIAAYARHLLRAPVWTARAWQFRRRARRVSR
ncbi:MAG: nucleotidyltransferase family protein [Solirubrobacterales bacterium]